LLVLTITFFFYYFFVSSSSLISFSHYIERNSSNYADPSTRHQHDIKQGGKEGDGKGIVVRL
jgi:hypothetical protein